MPERVDVLEGAPRKSVVLLAVVDGVGVARRDRSRDQPCCGIPCARRQRQRLREHAVGCARYREQRDLWIRRPRAGDNRTRRVKRWIRRENLDVLSRDAEPARCVVRRLRWLVVGEHEVVVVHAGQRTVGAAGGHVTHSHADELVEFLLGEDLEAIIQRILAVLGREWPAAPLLVKIRILRDDHDGVVVHRACFEVRGGVLERRLKERRRDRRHHPHCALGARAERRRHRRVATVVHIE